MSSPRVLEKETKARRCLAEIAIFDSVDLETLPPERLQRFLYLANEYSAYSVDPDLEKRFSTLQAAYNISPNLTAKIDEVLHFKLKNNPEDAMQFLQLLKQQEDEARMQALFERYNMHMEYFGRSVSNLFVAAEKFDHAVRDLGKSIFNVGASKSEIKTALAGVYAKDPMLARALLVERYGAGKIPNEYMAFCILPQELSTLLAGKKLDSKTVATFQSLYKDNPHLVVQTIQEMYVKKGLPIPAELVSYSKLPDGYSIPTGNIFVGPIHVDASKVGRVIKTKEEFIRIYNEAYQNAVEIDSAADGLGLDLETQTENVLKTIPPGKLSETAGAVCPIGGPCTGVATGILGAFSEDTQKALKSKIQGRTGLEDAKKTGSDIERAIPLGENAGADPVLHLNEELSSRVTDSVVGEAIVMPSAGNTGRADISADLTEGKREPVDMPIIPTQESLARIDPFLISVSTADKTQQLGESAASDLIFMQAAEQDMASDFLEGATDLSDEGLLSWDVLNDTETQKPSVVGKTGQALAQTQTEPSGQQKRFLNLKDEVSSTHNGGKKRSEIFFESNEKGADEIDVPQLADVSELETYETAQKMSGMPNDGVRVYVNQAYSDTLAHTQSDVVDFMLPDEVVSSVEQPTGEIEFLDAQKEKAPLVFDDVHSKSNVDTVLREAQQPEVVYPTNLIDKSRSA